MLILIHYSFLQAAFKCFSLNRILAFSEAPITAVHVSIDGELLGKGRVAGGPLYVLPWDPSVYLTGLHTIKVKVEVSDLLATQATSASGELDSSFAPSAGLSGSLVGARAALHAGGQPDAQLRLRPVLHPTHRPLHPGTTGLHLNGAAEHRRPAGLQVPAGSARAG